MGKGFILWRGFAEGEDRAAGDPREAGIRGRSPRRAATRPRLRRWAGKAKGPAQGGGTMIRFILQARRSA